MAKYDALTRYLLAMRERDQVVVEVDFADMDGLVGGLPASAREHRPWWANGGHVQALGWQKAGFRVEQVYLDRGRVRFVLEQAGRSSPSVPSSPPSPAATHQEEPGSGHEWPWEGRVQDMFAAYLREQGWTVTSTADTASKARGVDLLARKASRQLGAEVKGWPSKGYADPRRAGESKPTQPTNQAGHWFAQALLKAAMLLDSHPGHEALIVLPDYPRYRDLSARTRTARRTAGIHVVLVSSDGGVTSDTWTA